ncbi:hypothetical protein CLU96_2965 [Chryseobacterium sp. 52]|uniref:hypothetical protein n=1 Tax=Chryseobacterium sp. 52 TaxID=2035213 RepID=UPI000C1844CD|nr:hypothetical protein [Chryseobacterium sp. 52]PIF45949.1 hypothetical protein CLU96_2965 [Chryseobacterium sp. 52]
MELIKELSGTDVVIFDDTEREVETLHQTLLDKGIKAEFIKVDLAEMPEHDLINSIKLIFLDLNYHNGFGSDFDPYFCANLVAKVVPKDKQYFLVVWSKDIDKTESVIEILKDYNIAPVKYVSKLKEQYRIAHTTYDIETLLNDIDNEFQQNIQIDEFYGEIIETDKNSVLINCLLDKEKGYYQIRKFDLIPFIDYIDLEVGSIILIRSTTRPGSRLFEFFNESDDKKELFEKPDYFEGLENTKFFTEK